MSQVNDVVSGKIGDVSGKIGDVSGRNGVSGKIGDVSGRTLPEIHASMMQVRQSEAIGCLESKVNRLESEMFGLAQWLDARVSLLEASVPEDLRKILDIKDQSVAAVARGSASVQEGLNRLDERVKKLEAKP